MAKQCIYCGRPLAKDDARFCNDCGRSQVSSASGDSGAAAPSAIKVKLPPKEFTRADPSSARQESSLPGRAMGAAPVSPPQREQSLPPSSRMPKRPARLTPESPAPAKQAEPADDLFAARSRPASPVPPTGPTPAEEISTMVLPNWREELAQLRKEQELAGTVPPVAPEKKIERPAQEPPPLPRRGPNTPLPPREAVQGSSQVLQPRGPEKPFSETIGGTRAPQDSTRPAELPRRTPQTPLPQNSARPLTPPQRAQSTPVPPGENPLSAEASRRELRVKVWEQEATMQYPQVQEEKQEPGPVAAVEQNPFASVTFGAEDQVIEIEDMKTVNWQAPLSPIPASPSRPPVREEKQPPAGEGSQPGKEEKRLPAREESRPPLREGTRPPLREEGNRATAENEKSDADIEDLPTARLAVPEVPKPGAQIKVERASTPAPKKWSIPPTDDGEVEDLPTRPMTASPAGPAAPRVPQQPAASQMQSGERHPEPGQTESAAPFTPRTANPPSLPGSYGPTSAAQPMSQAAEINADPLASRGRPANPSSQPGQPFNPPSLPGYPANPNSQSGQPFNPPSLPPFPPGPPSSPGNTQLRPEMARSQGPATPFPSAPGQRPPQGPVDPFGQRSPQRPPSFEAAPASLAPFPSTTANTSRAAADTVEGKKPRKKRHTGRLVVVVLLLIVVVGGGIGGWLNREWVAQYFRTPAQVQPFQVYHNSAFGVSLDYINAWSVSVDQAHSTIRFFDNTHTGQANLSMAAASGQVGDYLNQQATQIPLDGPKTAPAVTFANSSWQVVQGTGTQSGATYTIVLYATQHNGHFYLLEFLAPEFVFKRIEQSSFAHMRSSFSFN